MAPNVKKYCPAPDCGRLLLVDGDAPAEARRADCGYCRAPLCERCCREWINGHMCNDLAEAVPWNKEGGREVSSHTNVTLHCVAG